MTLAVTKDGVGPVAVCYPPRTGGLARGMGAQMGTEPEGEPASEGRILGIDNVALDLPIASAGSRSLAAFLDYLLVGAASLLWAVAALAFLFSVRRGSGWVFAALIFGMFLIDYGYFAGTEAATGGRTFGKWALGLTVVTRVGGRPGLQALLVRNAVRTIDVVTGIPLMLADPLARRLGDRLAGTLVVHGAQSAEAEVVLRRIPRGWGGREVAVAESFLRRVADLEPERAERMARRLLDLIARNDPGLLAGVPEDMPAVETLRRVLQPQAAAPTPTTAS
jgi:uncharacterized RDD family membrane protein YckC